VIFVSFRADFYSQRMRHITYLLQIYISLVLTGCAVHYNPDTTLQDRKLNRQQGVIQSINKDLSEDQKHVSFGFGDEYIVKPPSFKKLDSLYQIVYSEKQSPTFSRNRDLELQGLIELEKEKVLKDTVLFKYELAHSFGIQDIDSTQFITGTFLINAENEVEKVSIDYLFKSPNYLTKQYEQYLRKESFIYQRYSPSEEELYFYDFFGKQLEKLSTAKSKGDFIAHTLKVMKAANIQQTLQTENVIKQFILSDITFGIVDYKSIKWSPVFTYTDDENNLLGYFLEHEWEYTATQGERFHLLRRFDLNLYFQITEVFEVDEIQD
jgi:hypothetical protein